MKSNDKTVKFFDVLATQQSLCTHSKKFTYIHQWHRLGEHRLQI